MPKTNRFQASRPLDQIKTKVTDMTIGHKEGSTARTFYLAQVIDSEDPKNANRIRVRIPQLDDSFYTEDNGKLNDTSGHDKLPYCLPAHGRMVDTPENGSVVLIALIDPSQPFMGRIWLSTVAEMSSTELFDPKRLAEEMITSAWANAETALNVKYGNTPEQNSRPALKSKDKVTKDKVGIRGKGKNKLLFETDMTTLIQNEGVNNKETRVELTEDMHLLSQKFQMLSSNSNQKYHPMFGEPNYKFQQSLMNLLNQIVTLLNTSPATTTYPGAPCTPSPSAAAIQAAYQKLNADFAKLKQKDQGMSGNIEIN